MYVASFFNGQQKESLVMGIEKTAGVVYSIDVADPLRHW